MYNSIEYSEEHSKISGRLWNYCKDILADPTTNSEFSKYKTSITGKTANNGNTKKVEFSVPLKHLSDFWEKLDIPLTNFEVSLSLTWSKNCVLTDMTTKVAERENPAMAVPTGAGFKITDTKLYVPIVTLSTENEF